MSGFAIRLERIIDRTTGKAVIVPLDHGATMGPMPGLFDIQNTVANVAEGGATAVLMHKGLVDIGHRHAGRDLGLIVHLSAGSIYSADPSRKVLVTTVEEALRRGADAVSIHLNVGGESESVMLEEAGAVSDACNAWGVPLLAMVYPCGSAAEQPEAVKTCVRVAAELGADIVKTAYTGSVASFREVTKGCPIPVLIAGGPQMGSDRAFLTMVSDAMQAGARGVSIGRGIFGHHDIVGMCSAVSDIVFRNADVDTALTRIHA